MLQAVFVVCVNLQGLFIFFFHCVRNTTVRSEWKSVLYRIQTYTTVTSHSDGAGDTRSGAIPLQPVNRQVGNAKSSEQEDTRLWPISTHCISLLSPLCQLYFMVTSTALRGECQGCCSTRACSFWGSRNLREVEKMYVLRETITGITSAATEIYTSLIFLNVIENASLSSFFAC